MTALPRRVRLRSVLLLLPLWADLVSIAHAQVEQGRIAALLGLRPGTVVADVGAGEGSWTAGLAEAVGPGGRVYATEVGEDLVARLRERMQALGLESVTIVHGGQESSGLPEACCDALLLRLVYHHFTAPAAMRSDLARALRPGGRLLIVETIPQTAWRQLDGVPERGGHGIEPDDLVAEMSAGGFAAIEHVLEWNGDQERFAILFRRADDSPPRE